VTTLTTYHYHHKINPVMRAAVEVTRNETYQVISTTIGGLLSPLAMYAVVWGTFFAGLLLLPAFIIAAYMAMFSPYFVLLAQLLRKRVFINRFDLDDKSGNYSVKVFSEKLQRLSACEESMRELTRRVDKDDFTYGDVKSAHEVIQRANWTAMEHARIVAPFLGDNQSPGITKMLRVETDRLAEQVERAEEVAEAGLALTLQSTMELDAGRLKMIAQELDTRREALEEISGMLNKTKSLEAGDGSR
jgi:hypothetical protein